MTSNGYLSRAALLSALTTLAEEDIDEPLLGSRLRIRELTAAQRQQANEAAIASGTPDNALYRAWVVAYGVIDPDTNQQLFTPADVGALMAARYEAVLRVATAILRLSEALPGSLKSSDRAVDTGQRDEGQGVTTDRGTGRSRRSAVDERVENVRF